MLDGIVDSQKNQSYVVNDIFYVGKNELSYIKKYLCSQLNGQNKKSQTFIFFSYRPHIVT